MYRTARIAHAVDEVRSAARRLRSSAWVRRTLRAVDGWTVRAMRPLTERMPAVVRAYDRAIVVHRMRQGLGYHPDLKSPRTYNEKLGWRILFDANPLLAETTDKVAVREYVASRVGAEVLIPVVGIFDRVDEIPWEALPDQFVLKASHGCEMTCVVRDKSAVSRREVLATAQGWLDQNYYEFSRERAYARIPRRLIIEELLLGDDGEVPADYKFLVFHGRTALIRLHTGRFGDHRVNFFDADLRPVPLRQVYPERPALRLTEEVRPLVGLAEKLAQDFDYARIDLYLARGQAWFGEITHHDGNASVHFVPPEFDAVLGALWRLPGPRPGPAGDDLAAVDARSWRRMESALESLRNSGQ